MINYDTMSKSELIDQVEALQERVFALSEDLAKERERVAELEYELRQQGPPKYDKFNPKSGVHWT